MSFSNRVSVKWLPLVLFVLCAGLAPASAQSILYAPAGGDSLDFRQALSYYSGVDVDYYDTSWGTPSTPLLNNYDMIVTLTLGEDYANPTLWGNRLANFVDAGGSVVLPGSMSKLEGRLTEPGYSPVFSAIAGSTVGPVQWDGSQSTRFHNYVYEYGTGVREWVGLRADALTDGEWEGGGFTLAYRPDARVVYINGVPNVSNSPFAGTGNWERLISNVYRARNAKRVLVFDESYDSTIYNAAVKLGCNVTRVENTNDFVVQASDSDGWDLIALEFPGGILDSTTVGVLSTAVGLGVPVLVQYWNLSSGSAEVVQLRDLLGVNGASEITTPTSVHAWIDYHPVLQDPNPLTIVPAGVERWFDNGDRLQPRIGSQGVAGFSDFRTNWNAAIVASNGGRSLVNGFSFDEVEPTAGSELAANEIKFLLHRSETLVLSTSKRNLAARAAEQRLGTVTVARSPRVFEAELIYNDFETVIVDMPVYTLSPTAREKIIDLIEDGGRVHLNYWAIAGTGATDLRAALRIADASSYNQARTIFEWETTPSVPWYLDLPLAPSQDAWGLNGVSLTPTERGLGIFGFTSHPVADEAATVLANDGFTLVNGFDYDSHPPVAMLKLLENQLRWLERAKVSTFVRGDCNQDGARNISDPLYLINYLTGGGYNRCREACDANDDGSVNIADVVTQLETLFSPGAPPLPLPGPDCDRDPTMDLLTCADSNCP